MNWETDDSIPGFHREIAKIGGRTYVAQAKEGMGFWRLFVKDQDSEPLRTIYTEHDLDALKAYAAAYQEIA